MVNEELLQFIANKTKEGVSKEEIKNILVHRGGWSDQDVAQAFAAAPVAPIVPTTPMVAEPEVKVPPQEVSTKSALTTSTPITQTAFDNPIQPVFKTESSHKGAKFVGIFVALVLLLGGGLVFGYYLVNNVFLASDTDSLSNEEIFVRAFTSAYKASSAGYDYQMSIKGTADIGSASIDMWAKGSSEILVDSEDWQGDIRDLKSHVTLGADLTADDGGFQLNFGASADLKLVNGRLYFMIKKMPSQFAFIQVPLNKWYYLDFDESIADYEKFVTDVESVEWFDSIDKKEFALKVFSIASETILSIERISSEERDGQLMHVFDISIRIENAKQFAQALTELVRTYPEIPADVKQDIEEWNLTAQNDPFEDIDVVKKVLESIDTKILIGKKDLYPYEFSLSFSENLTELVEEFGLQSTSPFEIENPHLTINVKMLYSDFNKPVVVEEPTDAINIEEYLGQKK